MFTGIIQEIGKVRSSRRGTNLVLEIESIVVSKGLKIGDSIAINGACQTIVKIGGGSFTVEAIPETLSRTNLGELKSGESVNLEPPLATGEKFHGHFVQGHIDCAGEIDSITRNDGQITLSIKFSEQYSKYLIEKGSVAIDGVSLTVTSVSSGRFQVALIPHTMENTTFKYKQHGDKVNLEFDMIAKYIERMMSPGKQNEITSEFLREHGFV